MILEQIEGNVKVTFAGKTLVVGDAVDDYSKTLSVIGTGKAVFRIDPNATFEVKGANNDMQMDALDTLAMRLFVAGNLGGTYGDNGTKYR